MSCPRPAAVGRTGPVSPPGPPVARHDTRPSRETTDQNVTMIYQATLPPPEATCDTARCATVAMVRVLIPRSRFDADGARPAPDTWDSCDLHWPGFRDATARNGHRVIDATGDPQQLVAEFPGWRIFRSDMGRLYASRPGTTVYGWLTAQLRSELNRREGTPHPGDAP